MNTITLNDPTAPLYQRAADYAKTWVDTYIKESKTFSDEDLNQAEVELLAQFDFPVRHTEVHLPISIDSEAAAYPGLDRPVDTVRVLIYAADPDDSVMLVLPVEVVS